MSEISAAARTLTGRDVDWTTVLPPDARQHDFSRNVDQSVDALTLKQLDAAARTLTDQLDLAMTAFPGCASTATADDVVCRDEVVAMLAERAFRRPPSTAELTRLQTVFTTGAAGASFRDGVALLARALLGSPNLLYDRGLGVAKDGDFQLSDDELESQLAWLFSGAPPDRELSIAARRGELSSGAARLAQAQRLASLESSRQVYRRFVEEWLGLSGLGSLAKSSTISANFEELRGPMRQETEALIDDSFASSGGALSQLFAGGYTFVPSELAELYGIQSPDPTARVSLAKLGRVGILQQASFLATYAHEDGSAPVLRGKAVLERLLCRRVPRPGELGIDLTLPAPDPSATTRERFAGHVTQPLCASCHDSLDNVGFSFENFDAVGRFRDSEAGQAVDTSGRITIDGHEVALTDSAALSLALASSEELAACAARQVVRFATGGAEPQVEDDFVTATRGLPREQRSSLLGLLLAYVEGEWFVRRTAP